MIKYDVNKIKAQFPALNRTVWDKPLIYLDSAASMQKPQRVIDAINKSYSFNYSNVHRGLHKLSEEATSDYEGARRKIGNFINANEKEVVFTSGATAAINLIAYSWGLKNLSSGDEIIITIAEHHANIVPWQIIAEQKNLKIIAANISPNEDFDANIIKNLVTERTKVIAFPHVSNVLGTVFPVKEICKIANDCGAISVVDGCQGIIHGNVDVVDLNCDFYCFSGHKLYGPTGIGVLFGKSHILEKMPPFLGGGDMIDVVKIDKSTYAEPPARFEAGTPPIVQAIVLGEAIDWVTEVGIDEIGKHEKDIISYGTSLLDSIAGVEVFGKAPSKTGVVSFTMDCAHSHDIATIIDREGIAVRAGHHCAQPLMDAFDLVSTTRASVGAYSTREDFDKLAESLTKVKKIFGA
ncbi:SufS family cysteine desulfurase [Alphaproteobacteria bacterium]|nr:SufS family cysteine desulfurase [Alphaproteobacteria bacterium]